MTLLVLLNHLPYDRFNVLRSIVCERKRSIVWKPYVDVRPILDVFRKELALQPGGDHSSANKKQHGESEHRPTSLNRFSRQPVIHAVEPAFSPVFDSWFRLYRGPQQIIAE